MNSKTNEILIFFLNNWVQSMIFWDFLSLWWIENDISFKKTNWLLYIISIKDLTY